MFCVQNFWKKEGPLLKVNNRKETLLSPAIFQDPKVNSSENPISFLEFNRKGKLRSREVLSH